MVSKKRFIPEIAANECINCKECFILCPTSYLQAAMFAAQAFDNGRIKFGMNHPLGQDNPRLLLNILHCLSGLLN